MRPPGDPVLRLRRLLCRHCMRDRQPHRTMIRLAPCGDPVRLVDRDGLRLDTTGGDEEGRDKKAADGQAQNTHVSQYRRLPGHRSVFG